MKEAERSRSLAFAELLKRKEIETEINDTLKRVSIIFTMNVYQIGPIILLFPVCHEVCINLV